jgi:hypothetical protein
LEEGGSELFVKNQVSLSKEISDEGTGSWGIARGQERGGFRWTEGDACHRGDSQEIEGIPSNLQLGCTF